MEKVLRVVLLVPLAVLLYMQAASLFVTPVPDSIRWYGDESWLMTEAIATVETGSLHHPGALSSTLSEPKSILFISVPWLRTLAYGVPASLAFPACNPVDVGRGVSFLFGFVLIGVVVWAVKHKTQSLTLGLSASVILAATRSFFFASHSARYDVLTGLLVLIVALYAASDRFRTASRNNRWFWLAFGFLTLAIGLPIYLYFYLAAIGIVAFLFYGAWREPRSWVAALVGMVAATVVAIVIQFAMTGSVSIWSSTQHQSEIVDVTRDIPVLRLFSLSAQLAVLAKNSVVAWSEAPWLFIAVPVITWSVLRRSRRTLFATFAFFAVIVWYFFLRPHPAYMMHILPLVLVAAMGIVGAKSGQ